MDRKTLIDMVNEIAEKTALRKYLSENESKKSLGKTQFRTLAEICEKARFYEEVKLLVEYKTAKGNGWDQKILGDKKCGEVIIDYMEKIKAQSDEKELLQMLQLFFGYLYWKATVLVSENQASQRR